MSIKGSSPLMHTRRELDVIITTTNLQLVTHKLHHAKAKKHWQDESSNLAEFQTQELISFSEEYTYGVQAARCALPSFSDQCLTHALISKEPNSDTTDYSHRLASGTTVRYFFTVITHNIGKIATRASRITTQKQPIVESKCRTNFHP